MFIHINYELELYIGYHISIPKAQHVNLSSTEAFMYNQITLQKGCDITWLAMNSIEWRWVKPPPQDTLGALLLTWFNFNPILLSPKSKEDLVKVTNLKNLPNFWNFEFWKKYYLQHTFLSCIIIYANMKWIQRVLWKTQSRHNSVHRWTDRRTDGWTDGQGETSMPPFQLHWSEGYTESNTNNI